MSRDHLRPHDHNVKIGETPAGLKPRMEASASRPGSREGKLVRRVRISQDIVFGFDRAGLTHLVDVGIILVIVCGTWELAL